MEKVGGFIVKNQDGTSTYKEGVILRQEILHEIYLMISSTHLA